MENVCPEQALPGILFCNYLFSLLLKPESRTASYSRRCLPLLIFAGERSEWPPRRQGPALSLPKRNRHMTGTPCQSAALDRIIAPWAAEIALFFGTIVKTILTIAEIVPTILHVLGTFCRRAAQQLLALWTGLSLPMAPTPNTIVRHVANSGTPSAMITGLKVLVRACTQTLASLVAARLLDRSRQKQPARANGDDGEGKVAKLEGQCSRDRERAANLSPRKELAHVCADLQILCQQRSIGCIPLAPFPAPRFWSRQAFILP